MDQMRDRKKVNVNGRYYNNGWFGRHPGIYELMSRLITPLRRRAARRAGSAPREIVDIATGTGSHAIQLARMGHDVVGVDLDRKMLGKARKKRRRDLMLRFFFAAMEPTSPSRTVASMPRQSPLQFTTSRTESP